MRASRRGWRSWVVVVSTSCLLPARTAPIASRFDLDGVFDPSFTQEPQPCVARDGMTTVGGRARPKQLSECDRAALWTHRTHDGIEVTALQLPQGSDPRPPSDGRVQRAAHQPQPARPRIGRHDEQDGPWLRRADNAAISCELALDRGTSLGLLVDLEADGSRASVVVEHEDA